MHTNRTHSIFGIPIDAMSRDAIHDRIRDILAGEGFRRIATVNPEFLVLAHRDERFRKNLLQADFRIPDGFGIVLDALLSGRWINRYPGTDLLANILEEACSRHLSVFLAVRKGGLTSYRDLQSVLGNAYPGLLVSGADQDSSTTAFDGITDASVVLCNFGAPEQEYLSESLRRTTGNTRLVMGVGGAFDFLSGRRRRAPKWMRSVGLEWIFRLLIQPERVIRICNAVIIFPFLCLSDRIRGRKQ